MKRILDMLEEVINMDKELHVVGKAKNGEEMYRIIKNKLPDVVLLDLIMPKMDSLTVMDHVISYGSEKLSRQHRAGWNRAIRHTIEVAWSRKLRYVG